MRLITLYKNLQESNNSLAQWENILEDDLDIKPYSKLALVNCNFQFNNNFIDIQPPNNQFTLFLGKNDNVGTICTVSPGQYNINNFTDAVQKAINQGIPIDNAQGNNFGLGLSCSTFIDPAGLFNIQFKKNTDAPVIVTKSIGIDVTSGVLDRDPVAVGPNNFTKFAELGFNDPNTGGAQRIPVCKGTFISNIKLITVSDTRRFIYGLISTQQDFTSGINLTSDRYTCSISNETGSSFYSINGFETTIPCEINDIIGMELDNGIVKFSLVNSSKVLPDNTFDFNQFQGQLDAHFLYVSLFGDNASVSLREGTTAASNFTYQIDPFFSPPTPDLQVGPKPITITFRITIDFTQPNLNNDLSFLLGYPEPVLGSKGAISLFKALSKLDFDIHEDSGQVITIDNIPLKSYNYSDVVSKKQSILYSLPSGIRDSIGVLAFNVDTLIPIDLNNAYPLNARNLRFSVRNLKDNSLELINEAALTIALLEQEEN